MIGWTFGIGVFVLLFGDGLSWVLVGGALMVIALLCEVYTHRTGNPVSMRKDRQ